MESLAHADSILSTGIRAHSSLQVTLNGHVITGRWQTGQLSLAKPIVLLAPASKHSSWKTPAPRPGWRGLPGRLAGVPLRLCALFCVPLLTCLFAAAFLLACRRSPGLVRLERSSAPLALLRQPPRLHCVGVGGSLHVVSLCLK